MKEKVDLRIIKTNKVLYEALLDLLKEQTFEEIKVSDICAKALVNRSTFYAHFNDKFELVASFMNDLKDELLSQLNNIDKNITLKEYYLKLIEVFLNHIDGQEDVYKSILINNRNSIIMDMMYNTIAEDIRTRVKNNELNVPEEIFISYYLGAIVNVGIDWLKSNKKYSKEEMLEYLDKEIKWQNKNNLKGCFFMLILS